MPPGYWNGELAVTADLIRNAQGLRQGVIEVRQLMAALRAQGCNDVRNARHKLRWMDRCALPTVERRFPFRRLMAPIVNVEHSVWKCPAAVFMRRELRRAKIDPASGTPFSSELTNANEPLCNADRVLFVSGDFDLIARPDDIEALHRKWRGSELLRCSQGHFGYRMMRETVARLKERGL